ncbi:hypothetical protein V6Z12_A01G044900 [Gossypium hirsutum]
MRKDASRGSELEIERGASNLISTCKLSNLSSHKYSRFSSGLHSELDNDESRMDSIPLQSSTEQTLNWFACWKNMEISLKLLTLWNSKILRHIRSVGRTTGSLPI